jgi:glycerol-3-phosphate dehydrogenase subunit C
LFGGLPAWLGRWRRPARWLVRARNAFPPLAFAAEKLLGLTARRPLPPPAARPFNWQGPLGSGERGNVWLFADTFAQHFDPDVAEAAIAVLTAGGYRVHVARPAPDDPEPNRSLCCGRTYLSMGMVGKARAEALRVLAGLRPAVESGAPIVGLEPSCLLSMRDKFFSLGLGEEIGKLGKNLYLFEEFIAREAQRGLSLPLTAPQGVKVHVHGHCHQKAFGVMKSVR